MKKPLLLTSLFLSLSVSILAQSKDPPFFQLDKRVKEERGGWAGSKEDFSRIFRAERARLADGFERELLRYLGTDIDKHYWVSSFLVIPDYLQGDKPLPHLALAIKQQALSLLRDKTDENSLGDTLTISVTAAVLSESLGLRSLAVAYKQNAEKILAKSSDFNAWFPAMGQYDRCLYGIVGKEKGQDSAPPPCIREETERSNVPRMIRVGRGQLDKRATIRPEPVLPAEAKKRGVSGEVLVEVFIDETGRVESAQAIEGHSLLRQAAVDAAYQARFEVTRLGKQPVKVVGVLTYTFKK